MLATSGLISMKYFQRYFMNISINISINVSRIISINILKGYFYQYGDNGREVEREFGRRINFYEISHLILSEVCFYKISLKYPA